LKKILILLLTINIFTAVLSADPVKSGNSNSRFPALINDRPVTANMPIQINRNNYQTYTFNVPDDAFGFKLDLNCEEADLDIYIRHGSDISNYNEVDGSSTSDNFCESMLVTRLTEIKAKPGIWYIDVVYQASAYLPIKNGVPLSRINYTIKMKLVSGNSGVILQPDTETRFHLTGDTGMTEFFIVKVPLGVSIIRLDAYDTDADIDLMASWTKPVFSSRDADYISKDNTGRETLIINNRSIPQIRPGVLYVAVTDLGGSRNTNNYPIDVSIILSYSTQAPTFLLNYPTLPQPRDDIERIIYATVGIVSVSGTGSGCIISEDGWILTNYHVIQNNSMEPSERVVVALTIDNDRPPNELFKAEVVRSDRERDLALIKITSGYYGQPLPQGIKFPYLQIGDDSRLRIGDSLSFAGFPSIGGSGSRRSVTFSRGTVAGFVRTHFGRIVKTDGEINSGSSGGPAFDESGKIIGLSTSVIGRGHGQLAYIHPVSLIPEEWKQLYRQ